MTKGHTVVGLGELLWDVFPEGRRLGGAPVNFACHADQLGAKAYPVSCVGRDDLGREIREALAALEVDGTYIAEDAERPTGTVQVTLDPDGKPSYEICEGVAWDAIPMTESIESLAGRTDAVCFGSLCQRAERSRNTIHAFLRQMAPDALKIFDVNLRQSFYNEEVLHASLTVANVLKLSDEELPTLAAMFDASGSTEQQLAALLERFDLRLVAYTRGADGSLLLTGEETVRHPGCPTEVVDSVGAGDSFTATLCLGLLRGLPLPTIAEHANRVAAYVCSQTGATPALPAELAAPPE